MASEVHEAQPKSSIGRRTFLKGSAVALGIAAAAGAGCAPKEELNPTPGGEPIVAPEEQEFVGSCRGNCFGGCKIKVKVREGKVVSTTMGEFPNKSYNRICQRGLSHLQRIYDPDRLKTPLKRAGARGENKWEEITWEEAINEIAEKWQAIMDTDGGPAIAMWPSAGGNFGAASTSSPQRLLSAIGMTTINSCYDSNLFAGGGFSKGTGVNEIIDLPNAKTVIIWGGNPTEAQPQHYHFIVEAQRNGAKIITIDPNYTHMASHSDLWIPIRPGTDTVLAMAMMNIAIENAWTDVDFIKKGTTGPFLVKETDGKFLRMSDLGVAPVTPEGATAPVDPIAVRAADGTYGPMGEIADPVIEGTFDANGIKVTCAYTLLVNAIAEWTPARAAELCDIAEDTIRELTQIYTQNGPSTIITGLGPDHYMNGHMYYFTVTGLAGITGNLGKPGATCGMDWPVGGFAISTAPGMTRVASVTGPTIPGPKLYDALTTGQLEGRPVALKSLYIYSSNPIANQVDRQALIKAFNMIDFIVVADMRLTDTTLYADMVLPVCHWFEQNEIMSVITPYMTLSEKAIEPPFECKTDVEIINLIANKLGFTEDFQLEDKDYLAAMLTNANAKALGATWENLEKEKCLRIYADEPYLLGVGGKFPTPSTREQFYRETPTPYLNYGQQIDVEQERLPYWVPPIEAWPQTVGGFEASPLAAKYPLIYTTERNKMKCHTQFGHNPWMLELYPEPIVKMHPDDAKGRGIAEGDLVRIFNDRGEVVVRAQMNPGIRPGMVVLPKGWEADQFVKGHYSDLTATYYNPTVPNNCYYDALCEVEKYEGSAK